MPNKKILIVEDYEDIRSCMKFIIEGYGYQVIEAANGFEAVESIKQNSPDLILMDIALPLMDGLTATRLIRNHNGAEKIPIIAVTAFGSAYFSKALESGCNCLISKPVDFDALEPVLKQFLNN